MKPSQLICIEALKRGPLIAVRTVRGSCGVHWKFGRRLFNSETVNALIRAGLAIRQGDKVMANA